MELKTTKRGDTHEIDFETSLGRYSLFQCMFHDQNWEIRVPAENREVLNLTEGRICLFLPDIASRDYRKALTLMLVTIGQHLLIFDSSDLKEHKDLLRLMIRVAKGGEEVDKLLDEIGYERPY